MEAVGDRNSVIAFETLSQILLDLDHLSSAIQNLIHEIHLLLLKKVDFGDSLPGILVSLGYLVERLEKNTNKIRGFMFEFIRTLYRVMTVMHHNSIEEHISLTKIMSDIYEERKEMSEANCYVARQNEMFYVKDKE